MVQSDRSLHSLDIACCTDLDALFNTRHVTCGRLRTQQRLIVQFACFPVVVSRIDKVGVRSVKSAEDTQERLLSLRTVKTHPYLPKPTVHNINETVG